MIWSIESAPASRYRPPVFWAQASAYLCFSMRAGFHIRTCHILDLFTELPPPVVALRQERISPRCYVLRRRRVQNRTTALCDYVFLPRSWLCNPDQQDVEMLKLRSGLAKPVRSHRNAVLMGSQDQGESPHRRFLISPGTAQAPCAQS